MELLGIPSQSWFPVATFVGGAALKTLSDALTHWWTLKRERESRREQRLDAIRLKRVEFQRATLLELQEVVQRRSRLTAQEIFQDIVAHKNGGAWKKQLLTEEVNDGHLQARANLERLRVRVRNEAIRVDLLPGNPST